jgi:ribonuclease HI
MTLAETYSKDQMPEKDSKEFAEMSKVPYRNLLGSLLYIGGISRPDINTAVSILSQFAANPARMHWKALKRVLSYLYTTKNRRLTYGVDAEAQRKWIHDPDHDALSFYVDANHGGCKDTGRSTTGILMIMNGDCVHHKSKKQKLVCNSTAAAELYAVAKAARWADVFRRTYFHLSDMWQKTINIFTDSQVVIKMLERGTMSLSTKHLHLAFHEIKEHIDEGHIKLIHVAGTDNPADLLTKPLGRVLHEKHANTIFRDDFKRWSRIAS